MASDKQEYAARTIRKKINGRLGDFLTDFPTVEDVREAATEANVEKGPVAAVPGSIDWDGLIDAARRGAGVGARGALAVASSSAPGNQPRSRRGGDASFLPNRLALYGSRNDPNVPEALSVSPRTYHFWAALRRSGRAVERRNTERRIRRLWIHF